MAGSAGGWSTRTDRDCPAVQFTYATHYQADQLMERLLNEAYNEAKALLQRNKAALDLLVNLLQERMTLDGEVVRAIVREHANEQDVQHRDADLLQPIL